jgi:hypothetical protein
VGTVAVLGKSEAPDPGTKTRDLRLELPPGHLVTCAPDGVIVRAERR